MSDDRNFILGWNVCLITLQIKIYVAIVQSLWSYVLWAMFGQIREASETAAG